MEPGEMDEQLRALLLFQRTSFQHLCQTAHNPLPVTLAPGDPTFFSPDL